MSLRIFLILLILLAIDFYVFQGVKAIMQLRSANVQRTVYFIYWSVVALCMLVIVSGNIFDWHLWPKALRTYAFALVLITYLSKIFVVVFLLIDDVLRLFRWISGYVVDTFFRSDKNIATTGINRYQFLVRLGFVVGSIPFLSMTYGMLGNAYNYKLRKVKLNFPNLPDAFDGLKMIQISDLHLGSFMGTNHLEKAVKIIQEQNADVIFFTGDLVNDREVEAIEFTDTLRGMTAPLGVYSIFGNHDYGDYYHWPTVEEKQANRENLVAFQKDLGWKLLLNEHTYIEKGQDRIGLIGVENWSARLNFKRYGDMKKAVDGMEPAAFNILLSHDPSHWKAEITSQYKNVDVMLAGHTHGMQWGVEIPGVKWSPVKYFYKEWIDLYQEANQYLYVNRGLGFLGYPGRFGILPEITLFELNKA